MVKETGFYALLSRMRYISRWGLMRSSIPENVQEHSHETAVYAHALGIIRREIFGQECDAERLAVLAVYHMSHLTGIYKKCVAFLLFILTDKPKSYRNCYAVKQLSR